MLTSSPTPGMEPKVRCHRMKANPTGYLWSKYECNSDQWLLRYRLLEIYTLSVTGTGTGTRTTGVTALRSVELITHVFS